MTKRVLLLLAEGFELLEAAGFTDVLGWANIDGEEPIEIVSAGIRSPLKTTFGFSVLPDALLSDLNLRSFDALAIPGGFEKAGFYEDALSQLFKEAIHSFVVRDCPVASVCVASLALGAADVVRGRRATTYHQVGGTRKAQLESSNLRFQFFLHSELPPRLGPLEWVFNTPSSHRVHHASNQGYLDRNYGGVLIVFDRLFGTYARERPEEPCRYGLTEPVASHNPIRIAFHEWGLLGDMARAGGPLSAIRVALGYPGRRPGRTRGSAS